MFTLAMGPHQRWDKGGRILVHPLIDGFMADGLSRVVHGESAGNELGGPPETKAFFDIVPDKVAFEPLASMGFVLAPLRPFLSLVRQIIAGINGRGVSFEFPRQGAGTSLKNFGDFPQGFASAFEYGENISFIRV